MRTLKWLAVAALAIPAAGCVESMDQGYGYSDGYYSPGYYAAPRVSNYYYTQAPTVVTQTRYVPVPTPVPAAVPARPQQQPQHLDRPHTPPQANNNPQPTNQGDHRNGNGRDRNGDGQPDHRS
jgi:hypothetical protein